MSQFIKENGGCWVGESYIVEDRKITDNDKKVCLNNLYYDGF